MTKQQRTTSKQAPGAKGNRRGTNLRRDKERGIIMAFKRPAKRINFNNGNWIEVSPVRSVMNNIDHNHRILGDKTVRGEPVQVDAVIYNYSYCKDRITDWHWVETYEDGTTQELPYSPENVAELPEVILAKVVAVLEGLDAKLKADLGTDDPNA